VRAEEVPQDPSFYGKHRRVTYAIDRNHHYVAAESAGWEVERVATEQALLALEAEVEAVRQEVVRGERAPLAYHLVARQMTPKLCAQHLGIATWRVKRHLKPAVFARLAPKWLARYADCLARTVAELHTVPDQPRHVFLSEGAGDA
jgi:hypothetical protein